MGLRWQIQKGFVLLPKSITPQRIIANADLFDFELTQDDMAQLDALGKNKQRLLWNPMTIQWDDIDDDDVKCDNFDPDDVYVITEGYNTIHSLNEDDLNKVKFALKRDIEQNNENVNKQLLIFLNGIIGTNHDDEDDSKAPPESPNTRKVLSEMFDEKERQNSKDFKETRLALQTNYENRASTKELKQANILKADIVIASTLHSKQNELEKNQKKDLLSKGMRNRSESKELSERGILHNNGMADSLQSNANKLHQQQKKDKLKAAIDNRASS